MAKHLLMILVETEQSQFEMARHLRKMTAGYEVAGLNYALSAQELILPGSPEYDENHDPDDEFDSSHMFDLVTHQLDELLTKTGGV